MQCDQVQLVSVPEGEVRSGDFAVSKAEVGRPGPGEALVRVLLLGLNAGLAHRLGGDGTAYGPGIGIGDVPASDAVVEVIECRTEGLEPGDLAVGKVPWSTAGLVPGSSLRRLTTSAEDTDLENHLTVLGHVGFTAWTGMVHVGDVRPREVVCVSGAAGGVGSCAVQFASASGATVIGIAGSAEKTDLLTSRLGADRAINRHDGAAVDLLRDAAPDGIDLFYDNVGGEQLEAALEVLRHGGRAVICGAVAPGAPSNYRRLIHSELTMKGFTVTAHDDLRPRFEAQVGSWLREGKVRSLHTTYEGVEQLPTAFASLLNGGSTGRVLVSMSPR